MKSLRVRVKDPETKIQQLPVKFPIYCEVSPTIVNAGENRHIFVGSGMHYALTVPAGFHLIREAAALATLKPHFVIGGYDHEIKRGFRPVMGTDYDPQKFYWKKNYCGVYHAGIMPADENSPEWVYSFNHCENKNEFQPLSYGALLFQNSVNPHIQATRETSSGPAPDGVRYRDYPPTYFSFVSMSYSPVSSETNWGLDLSKNDMGPVVWPPSGYLAQDGKTDAPGFKHPHSHPAGLIAEDPKDGKKYVYLFMQDSGINTHTRIIAARSPLSERAMPGSFKYLYRGEYSEPSLPETFSGDYRELLKKRGGKADAVHPTLQGNYISRFSVARLKRSGLFLSVERCREKELPNLGLRLSEDLRTWTDRVDVPNTEGSLGYSKFLSQDGNSHFELDESDMFYLLGASSNSARYRELKIEIQ